jgi:hypothetical protein
MTTKLNPSVTQFINELQHPQSNVIEALRHIILDSVPGLAENIKWNGPNYTFEADDRITMRVQPPGKVQLIFHRGAKKQAEPEQKLIIDTANLLDWKTNDRAVATFKRIEEVEQQREQLSAIVAAWIGANR